MTPEEVENPHTLPDREVCIHKDGIYCTHAGYGEPEEPRVRRVRRTI
jgi:hypothetical protein